MLKALEEISSTKKRITIEIPADTIEREILESLENLRKTTSMPGFRTGKAPMALIEKRFGKKVEEDVLERIIPKAYLDALHEADLTPVTDPIVEERTEFKRKNPFSMTLLVEVLPKVELNYEGIKVKDISVSVSDEDIDNVLKSLQDERATYEPSEEPVSMGDLILCDYSIKGTDIARKDQVYKIGGPLFPEDVVKNLIGKVKGSTINIETTFPEGYPYKELAGKRGEIELTIKDVKKGNIPLIDDEFAKDLGFNSLEELRDHLHDEVLRLKESEVRKIQKAEIVRKLLETHNFDIPESLLEEEISMLASSVKEGSEDETEEEKVKRQEDIRTEAVRNLRIGLLLSMIGKKEGVVVSDEDMRNMIIAMARRFSVPPESIVKFYISRDGSLDRLKDSIFEEKVLDLLLDKASKEKGEKD